MKYKIVEMCFFLCLSVYVYEWINMDAYRDTAPYICLQKYV